jgi:cytochrome P450
VTQLYRTAHEFTTPVDISSAAFWGQSFEKRDETFAWLRRHAPVSWQPPLDDASLPADAHQQEGFWAVTKAEDIRYVSLRNEEFSSAQADGVSLRARAPGIALQPILEMDSPQHTRYRKMRPSLRKRLASSTPNPRASPMHRRRSRRYE